MDNLEIVIQGIYDQRTIKFLRTKSINRYHFDFRPLSLNLMSMHNFQLFLEDEKTLKGTYGLHFFEEKDFVIKGFLENIGKKVADPHDIKNHFLLEFSDSINNSYYDQFKLPFWWHYQDDGNFIHILKAKYIRGIVLSQKYIIDLVNQSYHEQFIRSFYQIWENKKRDDIKLILQVDADFSLIPIIYDLFELSGLSYEIGPSVEVCYRNVHLKKLEEKILQLEYLKKYSLNQHNNSNDSHHDDLFSEKGPSKSV